VDELWEEMEALELDMGMDTGCGGGGGWWKPLLCYGIINSAFSKPV